jgi:predicted alpha/beta hydrolase
VQAIDLPLEAADGHRFRLLGRVPERPRACLLWLPALGVAAKHYLPFADALAERGIAAFLHEWRGNGSSALRAGRDRDWGYRELLTLDLPASETAIAAQWPQMPRTIGGHSLGGQLACCRLALRPDVAQALWLVASGAPYWRAFPAPTRWWLPLVYRAAPWLANLHGALPGHNLGFGGNEARGLIADWARTATSGRYAARGVDVDLEAGLAALRQPVRAVVMRDDWLGPRASLQFLLDKLGTRDASVVTLDAHALGVRADHFAWMRQPHAVVAALCGDQAAAATVDGASAGSASA